MPTREPKPDALIIGAPKAGTSALHAALARHPQVYASAVKEPKYYLCTDAPPPAYVGPGDAHSQQEWVWRAEDYAALFEPAPPGAVRLESTPFYLYLRSARRRIAEELPDARFVVIVRDPVDRAYSNWMHLYVDGLEPEADFVAACHAEEDRIRAGWAPFWHYRRMGRYGEQLADLFTHVERERVLVLRYFQLVSKPAETLDTVARFLGIDEGLVGTVPARQLPRLRPCRAPYGGPEPGHPAGRGRRGVRPAPGLAPGEPAADPCPAARRSRPPAEAHAPAARGAAVGLHRRHRRARGGAGPVVRRLALGRGPWVVHRTGRSDLLTLQEGERYVRRSSGT